MVSVKHGFLLQVRILHSRYIGRALYLVNDISLNFSAAVPLRGQDAKKAGRNFPLPACLTRPQERRRDLDWRAPRIAATA
jgi:hypothetical protein